MSIDLAASQYLALQRNAMWRSCLPETPHFAGAKNLLERNGSIKHFVPSGTEDLVRNSFRKKELTYRRDTEVWWRETKTSYLSENHAR